MEGTVIMFTKKVVIILFFLYQRLEGSKENKTDQAYQELFKKTIIGYDCGQIQNITSHKTTQIEACEEDIIHKVRTNMEVQILQKSDLYSQEAFTCSMRRTSKISHCGTYHHGLNPNSEEKHMSRYQSHRRNVSLCTSIRV